VAYISLKGSALVDGKEQNDVSGGIVRISENLLVLDLGCPEPVLHCTGNVLVIPRFDHEVFYTLCRHHTSANVSILVQGEGSLIEAGVTESGCRIIILLTRGSLTASPKIQASAAIAACVIHAMGVGVAESTMPEAVVSIPWLFTVVLGSLST
jgi:hypothetical protein